GHAWRGGSGGSRAPQADEPHRRLVRAPSCDRCRPLMTTATVRGLAPVRQVVGNGTVVIAKHAPTTPAVTIHASFEAGTIFPPPTQHGLAHFVSRTIVFFFKPKTAYEIAEE